jgi:hypothetical protein
MNPQQNSLSAVFRDKPELIIGLPDWMLSAKQVEGYRNTKNLAIVEIAGRDSVAAAVKSVEDQGFSDLLPTYVYTGTEFGEFAQVEQAVDRLTRRLPEVTIHPLLVMGSPKFWRALNGRFISELFRRFGFYTPCIGCHLYLHAARIPLAVKLGGVPIISGERESHTGMVKINQTANALNFYSDVASHFNLRLLFPVRHIVSGDEIENLIQLTWKRGKEQLGCSLSENYQLIDSQANASSVGAIGCYFEKFAGPTAKAIISAYLSGYTPDHNAIAEKILKCMP